MSTLPNTPKMAVPQSVAKNPLAKFFRQPAIYFMPPSQGKWWPMGSFEVPPSGEFAVYPMTSKDEVTLRTPDALINGQGMVDVIHSCIPDIKDAWKMPATDVDAVLIAMRIASYGHSMDFESKCPHCEETNTYALDLRTVLERIKCPDFDKPFETNGLVIKFRPQAYYGLNKANKVSFEVQKLSQAIQGMEDSDSKVQEAVTQMNRMVELNHEILAECTDFIVMEDDPENKIKDKSFIKEFYKNVDAKLVGAIQDAYASLASTGAVPAQETNCASCGQEMKLSIEFDYASFFDIGS